MKPTNSGRRGWRQVVEAIGRRNLPAYFAARWGLVGERIGNDRVAAFRADKIPHALLCRLRPSDLDAFREVFLENQLGLLDGLEDIARIVDCGAHVGFASAFLLNRYPGAQLAAVEPDPESALLLQRNLKSYGARARILREALWSHTGPLVAEREDGGASFRVREPRSGERGEAAGTDLPGLLDRLEWDRIDILKVDIGGAEKNVFQPTCEAWLGRVRYLAVELQDDESRRVFFRSVEPHWREITELGNLTLCKMKRT